MQFQRNALLLMVVVACLWLKPSTAHAQDKVIGWVDFYGTVQLDGKPAPIGSMVEATVSNNVRCGVYQTDQVGLYRFLPCPIDDPSTQTVDEGINSAGDVISFTVQGIHAGRFTTPAGVKLGDRFEVALTAMTPPVPVPEPVTITLFVAGLTGLAAYVYRQR